MAKSLDQRVNDFLIESRTKPELLDGEFGYHADSGNFNIDAQSANTIPVFARNYDENMAVANARARFEHIIKINPTTARTLARQYILAGTPAPNKKYVVSKKDLDTLTADLSQKPELKDKIFKYHVEGRRYGVDALIAYGTPERARTSTQVRQLDAAHTSFDNEMRPNTMTREALLRGFVPVYSQKKMGNKTKMAAAAGICGLILLFYGLAGNNPLFQAAGWTATLTGGAAYGIMKYKSNHA